MEAAQGVDAAALEAIVAVSCALSAMGAVSIMFSYLMFEDTRRKQGRRLLFFLSIADLVTAVGFLVSLLSFRRSDGDSFACRAQSVVVVTANSAAFLWTNAIAIYLYRTVRGAPRLQSLAWLHAVCWGVPVALGALFAWSGVPGRQGAAGGGGDTSTAGWCWVRGTRDRAQLAAWMLLGGKGVEWPSVFVVTPLMYGLVRRHVKKQLTYFGPGATRLVRGDDSAYSVGSADYGTAVAAADAERAHTGAVLSAFARRLGMVPGVLLAVRLIGNVRIILGLLGSPIANNDILLVGQAFFDTAQGFFNAIMFVAMAPDMRANFKKWFSRCGCCGRGEDAAKSMLRNTSRLSEIEAVDRP